MSHCFWCRKRLWKSQKTKEHIRPKAIGGGKGFPVYIACSPCNNERGVVYGAVLQSAAVVFDGEDRMVRVAKSWKKKSVFVRFHKWRQFELDRLGYSYLHAGSHRLPVVHFLLLEILSESLKG